MRQNSTPAQLYATVLALRHPVVMRAALIASLAVAMLAGGHPITRKRSTP